MCYAVNTMNNSKSKWNRGFTIVELAVVIAVVAILVAVTVVVYPGIQNRASDTEAQGDLRQAATKLEAYKNSVGGFPANEGLVDGGKGLPKSVDGRAYSYTSTATGYCLSTTSIRSSKSFKITDKSTEVVEGTCGALACETGYIPVPGDARFGTDNFCVMKYEAKNVASKAVSQAAGTPWGLNFADSKTRAQGACSGCHLITEREWMTIAANVLSVASNWTGGSVGSGAIYSGHNDNSPNSALAASTSDSSGYQGTGNNSPSNQRRTLTLTNGQVIWDFAANVWEWTDAMIDPGQQPGVPGQSWYSWREWNDSAVQYAGLGTVSRPSAISSTVAGYSSAQGIGQLYSRPTESAKHVYIRGGCWYSGSSAGILSLDLDRPPVNGYGDLGFRVAKS